jgi:prepilin peptidase CpaA
VAQAVLFASATFGVAVLAAAFDWQKGRIPNALTLTALVFAPVLHAWRSAPDQAMRAAEFSLLGAALCGVPLLLMWRFGWVAGGDVKLVAAMGALGGPELGLESVFLSFLVASAFIVVRLAWHGTLLRTFASSLVVAVSPLLPRDRQTVARPELREVLRFGPFACIGAGVSLFLHGGYQWL